MSKLWEYECPICKKHIISNLTVDEIKPFAGATTDCPACNGELLIDKDLTVKDFGEHLVNTYKSVGLNVSKEDALGNYIEIPENKENEVPN